MIDTLLIDLDNTILDFNKAEGPALAGALRAMGIEPTEELLSRYSVINLAHWKRLEKGQITMAEVKVSRFRQLFDEFGITVSQGIRGAAGDRPLFRSGGRGHA